MNRSTPRYGWYGDDFTGATDTLAALAQRGCRALLFVGIPTQEQIANAGPLDAVGVAGSTRAHPPSEMALELAKAGKFFAELGVRVMHYKCCSTFDSAPHVGNLGIALKTLRSYFPHEFVPIVGGQPNLGRYCLHGHLFATAGSGGDVHRIDRHPTMKAHPVTPMVESDLRQHLTAQGLEDVALLDYRFYEELGCEDAFAARVGLSQAVLMDVSRDGDLIVIGRLLTRRATSSPILAIGPSSVAHAIASAWFNDLSSREQKVVGPQMAPDGLALALVGSLSPVTRTQVENASNFEKIHLNVEQLIGKNAYQTEVRSRVCLLLSEKRNVMIITDRSDPLSSRAKSVAAATGELLREIMRKDLSLSRLIIAGGDTSSFAVKMLDIWGLSFRERCGSGVAVCNAHSSIAHLNGLEIVLKGGQMGSCDFFDSLT